MLKADQTQKTGITGKVVRSVGQQPVVSRKQPQYLEVAIEKSRKDTELNSVQKIKDTDQNNRKKQTKIKYIPVDKPVSKHNSDISAEDSKSQKNISKVRELRTQQSETSRSGKSGYPPKKHGKTFQQEKWFENKENQKLYEELDQILSGGSQSVKVNKSAKQKQTDRKLEKDNKLQSKVIHVHTNKKPLPKPVEQEVVLEYKRNPVSRNLKYGFFGPEGTKVWKDSERKQKQALENLDHVDEFLFKDDYTPRSKKIESKRRTQLAEIYAAKPSYEDTDVITGTISKSKNHIVADIPIYMPSFIDRTSHESRPPNDSVLSNGKYAGPDTLYSLNPSVPPPVDPLDTYRHHANPVSERILLEKAERERAQLEKETLKYFDTDQELNRESDPPLDPISGYKTKRGKSPIDVVVTSRTTQPTDKGAAQSRRETSPVLRPSIRKSSHSAETGRIQPEDQSADSRHTFPRGVQAHSHQESDTLEKYKYSPEGFQAHLERKARLEKEARILSRADPSRSSWVSEDEAVITQRNNLYPIESKYKAHLAMDSFRGQDNKTYRLQGEETQKGVDVSEKTYRSFPDDRTGGRISEHQHSGPVTYRASHDVRSKNIDERYGSRGIDQDRYSDRNISTFRAKDVLPDKENGNFSYRNNKVNLRQKEDISYGQPDDIKTHDSKRNEIKVDDSSIEATYSYRDKMGKSDSRREERIIKTYRQESEDKVEYILRTKTSDSKQSSLSTDAQRQSRMSNKLEQKSVQREDSYDAAVKVKMDKEVIIGPRNVKEPKQASGNRDYSEKQLRHTPAGNETRRTLAAEIIATARSEAAVTKKGQEDTEFNKYFMEPERPDSRSNIIPLYSDQKSQYSKQKPDVREKNVKTPVQETSYRKLDESTKRPIITEKMDRSTSIQLERDDKQTSTDNLKFHSGYPMKTDEKEAEKPGPSVQSKPQVRIETKETQTAPKQNALNDKLSRENTREKTRDNLAQQKTKEKTMDSQGPTPDRKEDLEVELSAFNIDDIEEGLDDNEIYVCYLVTDDGAAIGPMRLDIEDVQIGLPQAEAQDSGIKIENQEPEREKEKEEKVEGKFFQKIRFVKKC